MPQVGGAEESPSLSSQEQMQRSLSQHDSAPWHWVLHRLQRSLCFGNELSKMSYRRCPALTTSCKAQTSLSKVKKKCNLPMVTQWASSRDFQGGSFRFFLRTCLLSHLANSHSARSHASVKGNLWQKDVHNGWDPLEQPEQSALEVSCLSNCRRAAASSQTLKTELFHTATSGQGKSHLKIMCCL